MNFRNLILAALLFTAAPATQAYSFLTGYDEAPSVAIALERLSGDALKKLLAGSRMHKENQEWFLTLELRQRNLLRDQGPAPRAARLPLLAAVGRVLQGWDRSPS